MTSKHVAAVCVAITAGLLTAVDATAECEWQKSEDGHLSVAGVCTLAASEEWSRGIEKIIGVPLDRTGPGVDIDVDLELPNLIVSNIRNVPNPLSGTREIVAVITNNGSVDATGKFVVRGSLAITDAYRTGMYQNGVIRYFPAEFAMVSGLAAGETKYVKLHTGVTMPSEHEDFDMFTTAYVDWDSSYAGGEVWEDNEGDNLQGEHCRLVQAHPDEQAPPPLPPNGAC
jgi:hypothetical protein